MPSFISHDSNGKILAGYFASEDQFNGLLESVSKVTPVLPVADDSPALREQQRYKAANGKVIEKNIVQASADSQTFPADGKTAVSVTFNKLSGPATVNVAGQQVAVSVTDNVLTLSADAPQSFTLQVNDADQWSNPVTVEAQ